MGGERNRELEMQLERERKAKEEERKAKEALAEELAELKRQFGLE